MFGSVVLACIHFLERCEQRPLHGSNSSDNAVNRKLRGRIGLNTTEADNVVCWNMCTRECQFPMLQVYVCVCFALRCLVLLCLVLLCFVQSRFTFAESRVVASSFRRVLVLNMCRWANLFAHTHKGPHLCVVRAHAHSGRVTTACVSSPKTLGCLHKLARAAGRPFFHV